MQSRQSKQGKQMSTRRSGKVCSEHHFQGRATIARAKMTAEKKILHMYETEMYAYMYAHVCMHMCLNACEYMHGVHIRATTHCIHAVLHTINIAYAKHIHVNMFSN